MDGLRGALVNSRPDTGIKILSPEIKSGDRFIMDNRTFIADESGTLSLPLQDPGEHNLRRAN